MEVVPLRLASLNLLAAAALGALLLSTWPGNAHADALLGNSAIVLGTGGSGVKVRSSYGLSGDINGVLPEGTLVNILDGPKTGDEMTWYRVKTMDGAGLRLRGWAAAKYLMF